MIKIEQLKDGAKATYVRDGNRRQVYLHHLITHDELATLEVTEGTVVYSVDESEIKEQSALRHSSTQIQTATATTAAESAPSESLAPSPPPERKMSAKERAKAMKLAAEQAQSTEQAD